MLGKEGTRTGGQALSTYLDNNRDCSCKMQRFGRPPGSLNALENCTFFLAPFPAQLIYSNAQLSSGAF